METVNLTMITAGLKREILHLRMKAQSYYLHRYINL